MAELHPGDMAGRCWLHWTNELLARHQGFAAGDFPLELVSMVHFKKGDNL